MDLESFTAVAHALKAFSDFFRSLPKENSQDDARLRVLDQLMEAQERVLESGQRYAAVVEELAQVKEELAHLKDWSHELTNYKLRTVGNRAFVYSFEPNMESEEPPHWLCHPCAEKTTKAILQWRDVPPKARSNRTHQWICPTCGSTILVSWSLDPASLLAKESSEKI